MTEHQLASALANYKYQPLSFPDGVRAAVLCPLFIREGEAQLLLIKRSQQLKHHKGEVSFPGGVKESHDNSLLETCLRETEEEVGIKSGDVTIIGRLDEVDTTTGFLVSPFLGLIPHPYSFQLNKQEVEHLITVPIAQFIEVTNQHDFYYFNGQRLISLIAYHVNSQVVWGATARIVEQLITMFRENQLLPVAG
ncbi:MAG: CoA pyrophosphatase [Deltaproteobacteria bacterium]|nr:CoA pyrophosphatase [Candidatus Tharpellaceae bacterium]